MKIARHNINFEYCFTRANFLIKEFRANSAPCWESMGAQPNGITSCKKLDAAFPPVSKQMKATCAPYSFVVISHYVECSCQRKQACFFLAQNTPFIFTDLKDH